MPHVLLEKILIFLNRISAYSFNVLADERCLPRHCSQPRNDKRMLSHFPQSLWTELYQAVTKKVSFLEICSRRAAFANSRLAFNLWRFLVGIETVIVLGAGASVPEGAP